MGAKAKAKANVSKKKLGQFFTKNKLLQEKILGLIKNDSKIILEPSIGRGDLVDFVVSKKPDTAFCMCEIDKDIILLESINRDLVIYEDFLKVDFDIKFGTIIGNPPFVRTKNGNLYLQFIEKCFNLLEENGELIFIVPSELFSLTKAKGILSEMNECGVFTDIISFDKYKLFEDASVDVIIFRYCKNNLLDKKVNFNDEIRHIKKIGGYLSFLKEVPDEGYSLISDHFYVKVGMVSACEKVFKNKNLGNVEFIGCKEKHIFIEEFPSGNERVDEFLLSNKEILMARKIRKFDESNWFEFGAPRNIKFIRENLGLDCIYIRNLTRNKIVAFKGKVNFFGGDLILLKPILDYNLDSLLKVLNSDNFISAHTFSGRFKIGQAQLCNSLIY